MKTFLQTTLSFAFVVAVLGQGYVGRQRTSVVEKKVVHTPVVHKPPYVADPVGPIGPFGGGLDDLRGGGMMGMPDHIKRIIGSTVTGDVLVGGAGGFPRHGGTLNDNGLVNGWGADVNLPAIPAVSMWEDPLRGLDFPTDYNGQDLVFDPSLNRYVVQSSIGHQVAKSGGIITGGGPTSHISRKVEHNIVKDSQHVAAKTIGGGPIVGGPVFGGSVVGGPFVDGPVLGGPIGGGAGYIKTGSIGANVVDPLGHQIVKSGVHHDVVKSTGHIGPVVDHGVVKTGTHIGMSHLGTVNVGKVGHHNPGVIAHNVGKATLGVDGVIGHNIAKGSGAPLTVGFMDPTGPIASGMVGRPIGVGSMGHDIAKATGGLVKGPGFVQNPMHNVDKVGMSGVAQIGHDPLASSLGHGIAKKTVAEASRIVDIGSGGGVSVGNPIAVAATHGLAKESIHVAGKTLDAASSGMIGGHVGAGMDIFGQGGPVVLPSMVKPPVHPPVVKPPTFPTGYGRRVR